MRILAGSRVIGLDQCPGFECLQEALPEQFKILLCLIDGAERRRQIQANLNRTTPACLGSGGALKSRMKRVQPALVICASRSSQSFR